MPITNDPEWLAERKTYIGGSDIAAICGLYDYDNKAGIKYPDALDIYNQKTCEGVIENPTLPEDDEEKKKALGRMEWGHRLEPLIAEKYAEVMGVTLECSTGLIRHPEYNFLGANIDRWVNNREYILEIKNVTVYKRKEWEDKNKNPLIPIYVLSQVAWYSAICSAICPVPKIDIGCLIGGNEFLIRNYYKDKEKEDKLMRIGNNFWNNNVLKRIPPDPTIYKLRER